MEPRLRFVKDLVDPLMVTPGRAVELARHFDPGYTAGKDSTIKHVMKGVKVFLNLSRREQAKRSSPESPAAGPTCARPASRARSRGGAQPVAAR
jgi:hypothetical protein